MSERRYVVIGAGAVGGVIAAQLARDGQDVVVLARGEHARRIAEHGLTVRTPSGVQVVPLAVAQDSDDVDLRPGDILVLATKAQDAEAALSQWAWKPVAGGGFGADLPIITCQNGLATESRALRRFSTVIGATVVIAASYLVAGEVVSPSEPPAVGVIWIGRYRKGVEDLHISEDLAAAGFHVINVDDISRYKAAKLLGNVGNGLDLFVGTEELRAQAYAALEREARAVFEAAGVGLPPSGSLDVAATGFTVLDVPGHEPGHRSTWQSAARNVPTETDFLNGEIVQLARQAGVAAPLNEQVQRVVGAYGGGRLDDLLFDAAVKVAP